MCVLHAVLPPFSPVCEAGAYHVFVRVDTARLQSALAGHVSDILDVLIPPKACIDGCTQPRSVLTNGSVLVWPRGVPVTADLMTKGTATVPSRPFLNIRNWHKRRELVPLPPWARELVWTDKGRYALGCNGALPLL